jgi:formate--tetrahydrofolate ligase
MAIFCLARDLADLEARLGRIVVAYTRDRRPVTAADLEAPGAMTVLLKDALMPNLVQTLENNPALVHGGPFANIAHGCNSVVATRAGLRLADYVVTEAGFGADLGAEKFFDIKCRKAGLTPAAAVVVATCRALKMHGGVAKEDLGRGEDLGALARGLANLDRHVANVAKFGVPATVGINRFAADTEAELDLVLAHCRDALGIEAFVCDHWAAGSAGIEGLARHVASLCEEGRPSRFACLYPDEMPLWEKTRTIAREIYGAEDIAADQKVRAQFADYQARGYGRFPVCVAKTQYSFSTDPTLRGRPVRPRRARARAAPERRRGVRGRGLRRHHDHAGPAEGPGGARDPARRERAGGGPLVSPRAERLSPGPARG